MGRSSEKYRKMHIPDDPLYYEKFYFTPGDLGFPNFDTRYGRVGVNLLGPVVSGRCRELVALGGAQVIFYPTSIGWHPAEKAEFGAGQLDAWRTIQRGHAIANGVYVAVVNRVRVLRGRAARTWRTARRLRNPREILRLRHAPAQCAEKTKARVTPLRMTSLSALAPLMTALIPAIRGLSFGAIRLWLIRLGGWWRRRRTTKRKFWWSSAIQLRVKIRGGIGRFCATVASMRISRF